MLQKLLLTCLMCGGAALSAWAQQTCVIEGTFTNDRLRHTDKAIDKVYLNRMDEMENLIPGPPPTCGEIGRASCRERV